MDEPKNIMLRSQIQKAMCVLARWLTWLERHPPHQEVADSIPARAHAWAVGLTPPQLECDVSLFLSLPLPLFLKSIIKRYPQVRIFFKGNLSHDLAYMKYPHWPDP